MRHRRSGGRRSHEQVLRTRRRRSGAVQDRQGRSAVRNRTTCSERMGGHEQPTPRRHRRRPRRRRGDRRPRPRPGPPAWGQRPRARARYTGPDRGRHRSAVGGTRHDAAPTEDGTAATPPPAADGLAGSWTIVEGEAGYRVRETFLQQQADTDAVGRTSDVAGGLVVEGTDGALTLTEGSIEVDMTTLESDEGRRDNQLRGRGIADGHLPDVGLRARRPGGAPGRLRRAPDVDVTLPGEH